MSSTNRNTNSGRYEAATSRVKNLSGRLKQVKILEDIILAYREDHDLLITMANDIEYLKKGVDTALANKTDKDELSSKTILEHERRISKFETDLTGLCETIEIKNKQDSEWKKTITTTVEELQKWKWQVATGIAIVLFFAHLLVEKIKF